MKQNKCQNQVSKVRVRRDRLEALPIPNIFVVGNYGYVVEVLHKYGRWEIVASTYSVELANKIKKLIEAEQ